MIRRTRRRHELPVLAGRSARVSLRSRKSSVDVVHDTRIVVPSGTATACRDPRSTPRRGRKRSKTSTTRTNRNGASTRTVDAKKRQPQSLSCRSISARRGRVADRGARATRARRRRSNVPHLGELASNGHDAAFSSVISIDFENALLRDSTSRYPTSPAIIDTIRREQRRRRGPYKWRQSCRNICTLEKKIF